MNTSIENNNGNSYPEHFLDVFVQILEKEDKSL